MFRLFSEAEQQPRIVNAHLQSSRRLQLTIVEFHHRLESNASLLIACRMICFSPHHLPPVPFLAFCLTFFDSLCLQPCVKHIYITLDEIQTQTLAKSEEQLLFLILLSVVFGFLCPPDEINYTSSLCLGPIAAQHHGAVEWI